MTHLDYEALAATPLKTAPYDYFVVPNFVRADSFEKIVGDFPDMKQPGSVPPSELNIHGAFAELLAEMDGPRFRELIEQKFSLDLSDKPTMFTVRGRCRATDGKIHTDSESKIITVLLYLNRAWEAGGGRLRVLNNGTDLNAVAEEVPPFGGTLLVFRRAENSWHGHEPFEGERRAIQMNWVTGADIVAYEQRRHRLSSFVKALNPFAGAR
jgi:SM-20-related protein